MPAALELAGVRKSFDGFVALDDAAFRAEWGEVHALLGENGAGKSSLMNIAAGLYAPEAGSILVGGHAAHLAGPRDAAALGIGMVPQHFKLVRPFTVAENVLLGNPASRQAGSYAAKLRRIEDEIRARSAELGFRIDPLARVERLSIAEQQRVEILKVLLAGARILILDEPTAVLTDGEAERLLQTVHRLAHSETAGGAAVILVTHKMADVRAYADRVTVMRGGRTIGTLDPKATSSSELVRMIVGDTVASPQRSARPPGSVPPGSVLFQFKDLNIRAGEIYGLAGVGGNGQSELAESITTLHKKDLAAIPADRYGVALAGALSVAENFGIGGALAGGYGPLWKLQRGKMEAEAQAAVGEFNVQGVRSVRQKAALLSGGNAQKLVIAREFSKRPGLVLAHSPSRGLDVRASAEVHARLLAARDAGAAVLLISEDLDEVLSLADRVGVMSRGRIVAEWPQPVDRQAIGRAMVDHA
jgi:general nucleoside transport system ATP-binding protein